MLAVANVRCIRFILTGFWGHVGGDHLWVDQVCVNGLLNNGCGLGDHADRAFDGNRHHQPQSDNQPENTGDPPGRFFQGQPKNDYRKDQPICHQTDADEF